jgi:hypothetical protein
MCSNLLLEVPRRVWWLYPKHAVDTSMHALLRHPWLRKVSDRATTPGATLFVPAENAATIAEKPVIINTIASKIRRP